MDDLTIIYLTASLIPKSFAEFQRRTLLKAIGDTALVSVSREPLDFGINLLDNKPRHVSNIYFQMLRAAKVATTEFVAIAEDDVLYCQEHFKIFRPQADEFAYNMNRALLFTWETPTYNWKDRISNTSLIAPRKLLVEALEERFAKYPDGTPETQTGELGKNRVERNLRLTERKSVKFYSTIANIVFNHEFATEEYQRNHQKRMGFIRAFDIPHWGKASELVKKFYE